MKHLKKLYAVAVAIVMAMVLSVTAYAAENKQIVITLPEAEAGNTFTYKIYKVFDATNDGSSTAISYKLVNGKDAAPAGFTVDSAGNVTYTGEGVNGHLTDADIAAIAAYVGEDDLVATVTGTQNEQNDATASVTVADYGYYYITTSTGTVVTINSTNPDAEVTDKNILSTVVKSAGTEYDATALAAIAAVGTDQPFTAVITKGKGAKDMVFTDTMTDMTFNESSLTITATPSPVVGTDYTVTPSEGGAGFTVRFTDQYVASIADNDTITLNYTARVMSSALNVNPATNTATVSTGNSAVSDQKNTSTSEEVDVYNATVTINKVDGDETPLAGAKFKLRNSEGAYYAGATTDGTANWSASGEEYEALAVTDEAGNTTYVATFVGLGAGTYTLEESTVPAGYNKAADKTITVALGATTQATVTNMSQNETVVNNSGVALPSTGGIGTTLFYVIGGLMVAGAAIALVVKNRVAKIEK